MPYLLAVRAERSHDYEAEKMQAWCVLGDRLDAIIDDRMEDIEAARAQA